MPRVAVGNKFLQRAEADRPAVPRGAIVWSEKSPRHKTGPALYYRHPRGQLWLGDSLAWLADRPPGSVDLVIADPPYNLGKAEWDDFPSHDEYIAWSLEWIALAARALSATGSLYLCGFPEILADLRRPAARFFAGCRWLVWYYKNKANLGSDWGRSHEAILHYRKSKDTRIHVDDVRIPYNRHTRAYPDHPQATSSQYGQGKTRKDAWTPHPRGAKPKDVLEIPVTSNGMAEKTPHPTQKPEELIRRLILASSRPDERVLDPFAGSGTTLVCAEQLGRRWLGCDIEPDYCYWATLRLERVPERSPEEWIALDRAAAGRRDAIR